MNDVARAPERLFEPNADDRAEARQTSNERKSIMKLLGTRTSLSTFKWDFVYLLAQLTTDERPGIAAVAAPVQLAMDELEVRRLAFQQAQSAAIVTGALVDKRDQGRDRLILKMGGVARATDRPLYQQLFPKRSPSKIARLGIDAQSVEMLRILGELKKLAAAHPFRVTYEPQLQAAQLSLANAKTQDNDAELALTLERSNVLQYKIAADKLRLETHGKLVALLVDRAEADAFFQPNGPSVEKSNAPPVEESSG
jgi:hypothetical protein